MITLVKADKLHPHHRRSSSSAIAYARSLPGGALSSARLLVGSEAWIIQETQHVAPVIVPTEFVSEASS